MRRKVPKSLCEAQCDRCCGSGSKIQRRDTFLSDRIYIFLQVASEFSLKDKGQATHR